MELKPKDSSVSSFIEDLLRSSSIHQSMMPKKVGSDQEEGCFRRAPKGHFVVYVGKDQQLTRFVLPLSYLRKPIFHQVLQSAAEEYDNFDKQGRIVLPCDVTGFKRLVTSLAKHP